MGARSYYRVRLPVYKLDSNKIIYLLRYLTLATLQESANDAAVKAEIDNIVRQTAPEPAPFLRSFSLGNPADWTTPAVDFNRQFSQDGAGIGEPVPFIPDFVRAGSTMDEDDKRVAFGDEKKDEGIRKAEKRKKKSSL